MEEEILSIFKNYSIEILLIALGAFLLTYLVKLPIKKLTAKLSEEKRKMVNIIIVFIPLILSFAATIIYSGLKDKVWFSTALIDSSITAWLLSLSLYAIVSRIWIIIKGIASSSSKDVSLAAKQAVAEIRTSIKETNELINSEKKKLEVILESIDKLIQTRNSLASEDNLNLEKISSVNTEIKNLQTQEKELKEKIETEQLKLTGFNSKLVIENNKWSK